MAELFQNVPESSIKSLPRIPKASDLSSLFDQQRRNMDANRGLTGSTFGAGGCLGLGFRGTIPKLPSFKVSFIYWLSVISSQGGVGIAKR